MTEPDAESDEAASFDADGEMVVAGRTTVTDTECEPRADVLLVADVLS